MPQFFLHTILITNINLFFHCQMKPGLFIYTTKIKMYLHSDSCDENVLKF